MMSLSICMVSGIAALSACSSAETSSSCDHSQKVKRYVREYAAENDLLWPRLAGKTELNWIKFDQQRPGYAAGFVEVRDGRRRAFRICYPASMKQIFECDSDQYRVKTPGLDALVLDASSDEGIPGWSKSPEGLLSGHVSKTKVISAYVDSPPDDRIDAGPEIPNPRPELPRGEWVYIEPCKWSP